MNKQMASPIVFIDVKQLEAEGVSLEDAYTAQEIECFNKVFTRVSTLPKTCKEKAISIYEDCIKSGSESFITESRFSLSVWQEKQTQTEVYSPAKIKPQIVIREEEEEITLDELPTLATLYPQEIYNKSQSEDSRQFKKISVTEDLSEISEQLYVELGIESHAEIEENLKVEEPENLDSESNSPQNNISNAKPRIYRGIAY